MIISIFNLIQFMTLVAIISVILILNNKTKSYFNASFKKRNKKVDSFEATNLTLEKIVIICLQVLILPLHKQTNSIISHLYFTLILLLHLIICISFLIKTNEKIKIWNNLFNLKFIILITIICSQLLFLTWELHKILFANNSNFLWIIIFHSIFLFMTFKVGNQTLLLFKYLIFSTCKILITKKSDNFYFNQKKIFTFYSKMEAITNLWNFKNLKTTKEMNLTNIKEKSKKIIKNNLIIFIIACNNLFSKNIIKTQKHIINGWKNSLIE
ncbi:MAG: hypothetical protein ACRC8P_03775 [Spiroplasma sp.]